MTMDKVPFLSVGPPPPPPTSSPPRNKDEPDEDEDDAEVMQVVANGPSLKKRVNGCVVGDETERPMSWEGELSDDESMDPRNSPPPPLICHGTVLSTVIATTSLPERPLGSPMCMDDERHQGGVTRVKVSLSL